MNKQKNQAILQAYLYLLKKGIDQPVLLKTLHEARFVSKSHKKAYRKASAAQINHYSALTETRLPNLRERFIQIRKKVERTRYQGTLWGYLNELLAQNNLTWSSCPVKNSLVIREAITAQSGAPLLESANELTQIALWVGADPNEIMHLTYKELLPQQRIAMTCKLLSQLEQTLANYYLKEC